MPLINANKTLSNMIIKSSNSAVYNPAIPQLTNVIQTDTNILEATYNPVEEKISLLIDNTTNFDAKIKTFLKPFRGVTNTLDNSSVIISGSEISGLTPIISVNMEIRESLGNNEVSIFHWDAEYKNWTEKGSDVNNISSHLIAGLIPNRKYTLSIDKNLRNIISDTNGELSFDTPIGDTLHNFILKIYEKPKQKTTLIYTCKDTVAINYSKFGRHKQSLCEYSKTETKILEKEEKITKENLLDGNLCPKEKRIHNFMKNGDTNGVYSSYNKGLITEVSLLQAHINRILKDDYVQAAGPVDRWFRLKTKEGVKRLQQKLNKLNPTLHLVIDGIVGPLTQAAINKSC